MLYITVQLFRQHTYVNVENEDDPYLEHLILTAQEAIEKDINQPLSGLVPVDGELPFNIKHAIMLLASNFYENREPVSYGKATLKPLNYSYLITPYIKLT